MKLSTVGTLEDCPTADPECCVCADGLHGIWSRGTLSERILSEKGDCLKGRTKIRRCSPAELNKVYFEIPWISLRLFRSSPRDENDETVEFHLSGVALSGQWSNLHVRVPWDEETALLGDPYKEPEAFVETYYGYVRRGPVEWSAWQRSSKKPFAFPIHERCWALLERVIRVKRGESLGLLVQALNTVLNIVEVPSPLRRDSPEPMSEEEEVYQRIDGLAWLIPEEPEWEILEKKYGEALYQDIRKYLPAHNRRMNNRKARKHMLMGIQIHEIEEYYMPRDPLNVREVRDLVMKATERLSRYQVRHGRPEVSGQVSTVWPNGRLRDRRKGWDMDPWSERPEDKEPLISLPLDIIYMVVTCLQHPDMCNTLRAFRWQLPNYVWRSLFPKDIIFEYEEIKAMENLNWRQLYFRAHGLLKTSDGLKNRVRIMKILTEAKRVFLQLLEENNIPY